MIPALLTVIGLWIVGVVAVVLFFMGASSAPVPVNADQVLWFKHAAKVAHRRAS